MIKEVVDKLKAFRITSKITHEELSSMTGVSQKHISNIENHKVTPTVETLQKLAKGLGLEINLELLNEPKTMAAGE